jgi:hypothetical protein
MIDVKLRDRRKISDARLEAQNMPPKRLCQLDPGGKRRAARYVKERVADRCNAENISALPSRGAFQLEKEIVNFLRRQLERGDDSAARMAFARVQCLATRW